MTITTATETMAIAAMIATIVTASIEDLIERCP